MQTYTGLGNLYTWTAIKPGKREEEMNTYHKFAPNVFVAKCDAQHEKGETITLETKYGKEVEHVVFNLVGAKDGFYYYSIVRADGFDHKAWCERRAERLAGYAATASKASDKAFEASCKDSAFLSLGEPVKVGHHSERRHRKAIQQAQNNASKSCELMEKAATYEARKAYWDAKAAEINLSMPDSLEYYEHKLEEAARYHDGVKNGSIKREHAYTLTYAKKARNEAEKNLQLAKRLWG